MHKLLWAIANKSKKDYFYNAESFEDELGIKHTSRQSKKQLFLSVPKDN